LQPSAHFLLFFAYVSPKMDQGLFYQFLIEFTPRSLHYL
jgi:hypothetical protein